MVILIQQNTSTRADGGDSRHDHSSARQDSHETANLNRRKNRFRPKKPPEARRPRVNNVSIFYFGAVIYSLIRLVYNYAEPSLVQSQKDKNAAERIIDAPLSNQVTNVTHVNIDIEESVLPPKIISVIGLESSGTQFVTTIISNALGQGGWYREGSRPGIQRYGDPPDKGRDRASNRDVQVQHFSLPWVNTRTMYDFRLDCMSEIRLADWSILIYFSHH